jgi:hypothetical protein
VRGEIGNAGTEQDSVRGELDRGSKRPRIECTGDTPNAQGEVANDAMPGTEEDCKPRKIAQGEATSPDEDVRRGTSLFFISSDFCIWTCCSNNSITENLSSTGDKDLYLSLVYIIVCSFCRTCSSCLYAFPRAGERSILPWSVSYVGESSRLSLLGR